MSEYRVIRNDCQGFNNLILQMQPHVFSFYGVTSRIRFMSLLFPPNIPELKVRIRTAIETITSDRPQTWNEFNYCVHICRITNGAPVRYVTKSWSVFLLNKKKYIYCYLKCIVYGKMLKPRHSFRITPCNASGKRTAFQVFTVFWDAAVLFHLASGHWHVEGNVIFQMLITNAETAKPLRMETPQSFETSGTTCPPTQHHTTMRTWNLVNFPQFVKHKHPMWMCDDQQYQLM